ncbi:hypothetical protein ARMSODRAFT_970465 [Armillaria solidipes]|uniref:Uncharacterized protein n=1 Tax=Armillaria solidipes TaxID=1076256 RepID=A0A2H3CGN3_9AGAR|nr:hypothetical protein ARMSODRAFT_970465 [Armillaria solidipes]
MYRQDFPWAVAMISLPGDGNCTLLAVPWDTMLIQIQHGHLQLSGRGPMIVERFLIGADPRNTNRLWDQMFRWSMFYGRKGFPIAHRPRYMGLAREDLRGAYVRGSIKDGISFYITGPEPTAAKAMGFWGSAAVWS